MLAGVAGSTLLAHPASAPSPAPAAAARPAPTGESLLGLDVSAYQHGVDWHRVKALGARFAYVKATEGTTYTSARFRSQYSQAARVGVPRGAFHFAKPNESGGEKQAAYFVKALEGLGGGRVDGTATLPPLLDLEYDPYVRTDGTDSCWGLTPEEMTAWVSRFSDTVVALTGRVPLLYTTADWWKRCTGDSDDFPQNPLFLARYVDDPTEGPGGLPASWSRYTIWQYTNAGRRFESVTDGSPGDTVAADQDLFAGSPADLRALARSRFEPLPRLAPLTG
ncbi:Lysozyme M1 [Frondihabitans sp. 762G35]|nr:Lysozyme M1 [Frondihabitans sp. 762G35]